MATTRKTEDLVEQFERQAQDVQDALAEMKETAQEIGQSVTSGADYEAAELAYEEVKSAERSLESAVDEVNWIGEEQ